MQYEQSIMKNIAISNIHRFQQYISNRNQVIMFQGHQKHKDFKCHNQEAETGEQFYKDQSFSFEIQAEKEYVHRLKQQREKIEALYMKYDSLLTELRKKDQKIRELEKNISAMDCKFKEMSLMIPELEMSKHQNYRLISQNESLKCNIGRIEDSYNEMIRQLNSRYTYNEQQAEKIGELNSQLTTKLRIWQQKHEDKQIMFEKERKSWQQKNQGILGQLETEKSKNLAEINMMNEELLKKDEHIDILQHEIQKMKESLLYLEQSNLDAAKENEIKTSRLHHEYKQKIKMLKSEAEELEYNNEMLSNKITLLNSQVEKINQENSSLRSTACEQKKYSDEALYHLKLQFSQEKSVMREHTVHLENKITKLEKQLGDSMRRQKGLVQQLNRMQQGESVKKGIREIERRQLQKINRLLLLQK